MTAFDGWFVYGGLLLLAGLLAWLYFDLARDHDDPVQRFARFLDELGRACDERTVR